MRRSIELGIIGLGKMEHDMSLRLLGGGYRTVVFDIDQDKIKHLTDKGAVGANSVSDIIAGSIMKCNTWKGRKEPVILSGYGETIPAFEY